MLNSNTNRLKGKFILTVKDFYKIDKPQWEKLDFPESLFDYILEKCDKIKQNTETINEKPKEEVNNNNNNNNLIDINTKNTFDMNSNINSLLNKNSKKKFLIF